MSVLRKKSSFWDKTGNENDIACFFPQLRSNLSCEVCVIGGGITGVTLAYLLASKGKDVVLLEADHIGSGATGASSAHLDPLTDLSLSDLLHNFGKESAQKVLESNFQAMGAIERLVKNLGISCDFEKIPGAFIAETFEEVDQLKRELQAARELGVDCALEENPLGPFPVKAKLVFNRHARFHPLKYLFGLAKAAKNKGARIFQYSRARDIQDGKAVLANFSVRAAQIVMATHAPFGFYPLLQSRLYPYRSYVIGARLDDELEDSLFWDLKDPYRYIRKAWDDKGEIAIIGGADHKTGKPNEIDSFSELENYARQRFRVSSIDYAWSGQYYLSADGLPYIGKTSTNENVFVATGFEGNGLSFGTVAARILDDLILGRDNDCAKIYSPSRLNIANSGKKLAVENFSVAKEFILDRLERPKGSPFELQAGEGKIVSFKGELLACYREPSGRLRALSPVCRHAKCHVKWNNSEDTWDCPCHGGRYSATGEVILGPPTQNLKNMDYILESEEGAAHP